MWRPGYNSVIAAYPGGNGGRSLLLHRTGSIWGRLLARDFLDGSWRYFSALRSSRRRAGRNGIRETAKETPEGKKKIAL